MKQYLNLKFIAAAIWGLCVFLSFGIISSRIYFRMPPTPRLIALEPLLPYLMLPLSFFIFRKAPKIIKYIHHGVVSVGIIVIFVISPYLFIYGKEQAGIGSYFTNCIVGMCYIKFLIFLTIALIITKLVNRKSNKSINRT